MKKPESELRSAAIHAKIRPRFKKWADAMARDDDHSLAHWLEKMIQIIFRLRDLGIESPKITNELIDELHKVTRLREESVANLQGTCVPEYSRLVS